MIEVGSDFSGVGAFDQAVIKKDRIRKLTELECFRLMDFPDEFMENIKRHNAVEGSKKISPTQLYKQAGNSIPVALLEGIISRLKLKK